MAFKMELVLIVVLTLGLSANTSPLLNEVDNDDASLLRKNTGVDESTETIPQDLYVIRAIVYEVGILTNISSDENSTESDEEVDVTFFDPRHNGSFLDLSNIPVPLQTNVSGHIVTGVAPVNLGSLALPNNGSSGPLIINSQDNVTPFSVPNAYVSVISNISTTNSSAGENILSSLQPLLSLTPQFPQDNASTPNA